jgi:c-di-GMP-binding flagellar brake protein YcgR
MKETPAVTATVQPTGASRRRVPRRNYRRSVGILFHGQYEMCRSVEIGEGGMKIQSVSPMRWMDHLVITFNIPGENLVCIRAEIRYEFKTNEPTGNFYGIQFMNIDFKSKRKIRNYVAARTEKESLDLGTERDRRKD